MTDKFYYEAYNLNIETELELPRLSLKPFDSVDVRIIKTSFENTDHYANFIDNDFNRVGDTFYIYILDVVKFHISCSHITYEMMPNVNEALIIHYILGLVMASLLQLRGTLILHGSSLQHMNQNIIVMGDSGSGKSTVCNRFIHSGAQYITDDVICFESTVQGLKVLPDFGISKVSLCNLSPIEPIVQVMYCEDPRIKYYQNHNVLMTDDQKPVKKVVIIRQTLGGRVNSQNVFGAEKVQLLVDNIYRESLFKEEEYWQDSFKHVLKIASSIDVLLIRRPKDEDSKDQVYSIIKDWIEGGAEHEI